MACLPKNRYKYYRDQFIQLVGAKNAKDFTIKKVNDILNSKAPRWFFNKGIEDDTECALKTLMYSYVKSMETKKDGSKTFFKDGRINEIANQLFNIKMDKESVGRFMSGITVELVSEKLVNDSSKKIEKPVEKKVDIKTKLQNAQIIWGHPASGKTTLVENGNGNYIDFDTTWKPIVAKRLGIDTDVDTRELPKVIGKLAKEKYGSKKEYKEQIEKAFFEAIEDAKKNGKKLLVSDLPLLEKHSDKFDLITNMSESKFLENSHKRGETDDEYLGGWKNDINTAIDNARKNGYVIDDDRYINEIFDVKREPTQNTEPQKYSTMTDDEIASKVIYSTFPCSNLFNNSMITGNAILKKDVDTIVVYSDSNEAQDKIKSVADSKGISVYINPSENDLKKAVKNHSKIGIIKSPEHSDINVDEIFKDENVKFKEAIDQNYKFIPCNDLILYQRKIQYLFNKLKKVDERKEITYKKVLDEINKELANEVDPRKFDLLLRLVEDYDNISSLCVVNEKIEEDMDEYSGASEDDKLWSEQHSTSTMPKDEILVGLLSSFPTGEIDELGTPIYYDPMVINNILCNIVSGAKDSADMIERLKANKSKKKFIEPFLENLEKDETGRLKSIVFTKYANLYKSNYITFNNGKIINEENGLASTSINLGYCSNPIEGECIFSKEWDPANDKPEKELGSLFRYTSLESHPNQAEIQMLKENGVPEETIKQRFGIYDFRSPENLNKLTHYLSQIGVELTKEHNLNNLTDEELIDLRNNAISIYWVRRTKTHGDTTVRNAFIDNNKNYYSNIIDILNSLVPMKTESIVRTAGESQFIYANKTYIDGMMDGLLKDRENYIQSNFLDVEFFTSHSDKGYEEAAMGLYNPLLRELALSEDNNWFKCFTLFVKKENSRKPKKYSELTPDEIRDLNKNMFWREDELNKKKEQGERQYALVHAPIYSDKSTLHYYRVPIIDIQSRDGKEPEIIKEIKNLIIQETNRIKSCKQRAKLIAEGKIKPIDRYDTIGDKTGNGERYMFLPALNQKNKSGETFFDVMAKSDEKQRENLLRSMSAYVFRDLLKTDLGEGFNNIDVDSIYNNLLKGDYDAYNAAINKNITAVSETSKSETLSEAITRISTQFMHTSSILQLTVTDPAYYKNDGGIDIQKRYAEVMAGYQRPDLNSKYARKTMRSLFLKDCIISLSEDELNNIRTFLTNAKKEADIDIDVEAIVNSMTGINIADAQSYRTLSSYRSVRDMFGQWSAKDEELYNKLKSHKKLTKEDYEQVWQTLKPFVYTQQKQEWKDENGDSHYVKVGYQYKNSEAVLFYIYSLFGNEKTKSVLSELNRFMEDYQIDTAQFESAVKVGNQGLLDLNSLSPDEVYDYLKKETGVEENQEIPCQGVREGSDVTLPGNPNVIHEIPYSEYGIKTSTPPHMFDEEEQIGSQTKKLVQGDIPEGAKIYIDTNGLFTADTDHIMSNGKEIKLEKDADGKPYLTKDGFLQLYNDLLSDMILDNYTEVQKVFKDKQSLSKELLVLMGSSPKYDFDIKQSCKVRNDKFVVNLKNPNIKDKLTALISSVIKNKVNKQLIRGGTAIQMTCWGYGDKDVPNIVRDPKTGAIQYMECYMPAYSKKFIESMIKEDGTLDTSKVKDNNLLNGLCYRIPTEDLYSTIPLKIKGFLPMQFGTNIMLPKEITELTGSDFDVDKMYLMLPDFEMKEKWAINKDKAMERFKKSSIVNIAYLAGESSIKKENEKRIREGGAELTDKEKDNIRRNVVKDYFKMYCVENRYIIQEPKFVKFDNSKDIEENDHSQKANLLLSLIRGCVSSPCNVTKTQNPGGFKYLKDIVKEFGLDVAQPMNMTEEQYLNFNRLNMVARKLIGIYANHNAAHAIVQGSGLSLKEAIKINGTQYQRLDGTKDTKKRRISRNLCEFLAAAPDNAKDPVLAKLWQNTNTAGVTCFLLRLGVPTKDIITMFKNAKEQYPESFEKFMTTGATAFKSKANDYIKKKREVDIFNPINFFNMIGYYADTIKNIENLNQVLKTDSTNGAMFGISDIIKTITNVKKLRNDSNIVGVANLIPEMKEDENLLNMSKSEIKKKLGGNPKSYQIAYYLTFANFKKYYKDVLDEKLIDELSKLGEQVPRFTEENINDFINEYTRKQIRYLDYFKPKVENANGKFKVTSTQDILDQTTINIPLKFEEYKSKYPNNAFIKSLDKITDKRGNLLCVRNIADLRPETINEIKAGFYQLYNNAVSFNDANDLLHYTLAVDGFKYSPTSFLSVIPVEILDKIPGMNDIFNYFEIENIERFEDEFLLGKGLIEYDDSKPTKSNRIYRNSTSRFIKVGKAYYKRNNNLNSKDGQAYDIYATEVSSTSFSPYGDIVESKQLKYFNSDHNYYEKVDEYVADLVVDSSDDRLMQIVEDIVKRNRVALDKEKVVDIIKNANFGRFFSIDSDPINDYSPIGIDWC